MWEILMKEKWIIEYHEVIFVKYYIKKQNIRIQTKVRKYVRF